MVAKKDKYDLLASVIDAIYDENQDILVETTTLDAKRASKGAWFITDKKNPQIPTKRGALKTRMWSKNREHAESIKIGKISMRRIPLDPVPTKDGKYMLDRGYDYIVRTPQGEATFYPSDDNFLYVWSSALRKYDFQVVNGKKGRPSDMSSLMNDLYDYVKNPKLKAAAGKYITKKDAKSRFDKAKENLESLGVVVDSEKLRKRLVTIQKKTLSK